MATTNQEDSKNNWADIFQDPNFITGMSILAANMDPRRHWSEGFADASRRLSANERSRLVAAEIQLRKETQVQKQREITQRLAQAKRISQLVNSGASRDEVLAAALSANMPGALQAYLNEGRTALPTSAQLFEYRKAMPEAERTEFDAWLETSRRSNPSAVRMQPIYTSQGVFAFNPSDGSVQVLTGPNGQPLKQGAYDPETIRDVAESREAGKLAGKRADDALRGLGSAEQMISAADDVLALPAEAIATQLGAGSMLPNLSGTARNTGATMNRLDSQTALSAIEFFRGTGPITEVELAKGQQAAAKLDRAQTPDAYLSAVREYRNTLESMRRKYTSWAAQGGLETTSPAIGAPPVKSVRRVK